MDEGLMVTVCRDTAELEQKAAETIAGVMESAIRDRRVCFVAFSGGETPRQIYRRLGMNPLKDRVDWRFIQLFFSDERCVPPDDPRSNYGMVERALLSLIDLPPANIHRIKGEMVPTLAAQEYEHELTSAFGDTKGRFDLMLLGLGEDGHVASLFPGTTVLDEQSGLVRPVTIRQQKIARVTLTFPVINNAREILFLVSGKRKSSIVKRVLSISRPSRELPATLVRPLSGRRHWLMDSEAASQIDPASYPSTD